MLEYIGNGKPGFYFLDVHVENILKILKYTLSGAKKYNPIHLNNIFVFSSTFFYSYICPLPVKSGVLVQKKV
jgi:hypothetical protein